VAEERIRKKKKWTIIRHKHITTLPFRKEKSHAIQGDRI